MNIITLSRSVGIGALVLIGASLANATPVQLVPDTTIFLSDDEGATALDGGTDLLALASQYSTFNVTNGDWILDGRLRTRVMSGVTANTLGGLTFVYEVENTTGKPGDFIAAFEQDNPTQGILNLLVPGWGNMNALVAKSSVVTSPLATANPGEFKRDLSGTIDFTFPPDVGQTPPPPPIFAQEVGWQLIVHTAALDYAAINATVVASNFDFSSYNGYDYQGVGIYGDLYSSTVGSYVAVSVPDEGSAVLLLILGLSALLVQWRRRA